MMRAFLLVMVVIGPAAAHADNKAAAREAYTEASRHYDVAEYAEALAAFKRAYLNYEEPAFLYNIAQCHRQLGNKADAITFYRNYLRKVPDAKNRDEVLALIANLEAAIQQEQATKAQPPTDTIAPRRSETPPPVSPPPTSPEVNAPPPVDNAPQANPLVAERPAPARHTPVYKKWWLWTAVAVVAAGAATGIALGVTQGKSSEPTLNTVHVP